MTLSSPLRTALRAALVPCAALALSLSGCDEAPAGDDDASGTPSVSPTPTPTPGPAAITFPSGFLFGASIAGFQADMGCPTLDRASCEDPNSDWFVFTTTQAMIDDPNNYLSGQDPSDVGPGHWELYEADLDRVKDELKHNAMRFSIEWSRIFPTATDGIEGYDALRAVADPEALAHYHALLQAMKARGITPLVTLNHYTLPTWIHDTIGCHADLEHCSPRGWLDHDRILKEIAKYSGFVAQEFGGEIDRWATLNEPLAVVLAGYLFPSDERSNPPSVEFADVEAKAVFNTMIEAHARMYDAVKAGDKADADSDGSPAEVGIVYNMAPAEPADPNDPVDVEGAQNVFYLYNMAFLNAVALGMWDEDLDGQAVYREDLDHRMDYIGLNYYTKVVVKGTKVPLLPSLSVLTTFNPYVMEFDWDYPEGIYEMSVLIRDQLSQPVIITENGTQDPNDDGSGGSYIVRHLTWLSRAMDEGVDVRGYFYWTLMDNYEWNHGMNIRMGLFAVSATDPLKTRTARKSVGVYAGIAGSGSISPALQAAYPAD